MSLAAQSCVSSSDSKAQSALPARHYIRRNTFSEPIKKKEPPATFDFFSSQKPKCRRDLICGWNHHETIKKQHVVLCGHEDTVSNPHRTFVAPVTRISEGRNKKSHRRAPRDAELFTPQWLPRPEHRVTSEYPSARASA